MKGKPEKSHERERGRRTFSAEFKAEAVELMRRRRALGISLAQIGRELEVAPTLLWEWARRLDGRGTGGGTARSDDRSTTETLEEEVRRLRREVVVLRQEREFAKKAVAFFAKESR